MFILKSNRWGAGTNRDGYGPGSKRSDPPHRYDPLKRHNVKTYTLHGETFIMDEARELKIEKAARRFAARHNYGIARESSWWTWVEHFSQINKQDRKAWKKVFARAVK